MRPGNWRIPGLDDAIHQYNEALELDPTHLPSLYRLGVIYAEQKNYDASIEVWKRYIAVSKMLPPMGISATATNWLGSPVWPRPTYHKGIEKDPNNAGLPNQLRPDVGPGRSHSEAVRMWNPVLTEAQVHYNLASIYLRAAARRKPRLNINMP